MDVPILLSVLSPIATLGGVFFLNNILKGYLSKKSENLATKQDIEEITDKIESVKIIYASQLHVSQVRYEKEFEILSDLTAKLVEMRDAALSLRPVIDFVPKDEEVER